MGDEHHGVALPVELLQHSQHLAAGVAVQRAGGLVGQNDRRVTRQSTCNGDTLLLAAGKLVGLVLELIAQPYPLKRGGRAALALSQGDARVHQRHLHVFQQAELGQQVILLEDEAQHLVADLGQLVLVHLAHIPAIEPIGARRGHVQAADDVHAGGFARAGLADDGHELAFVDLHGDMVGSLDRRVTHLVILAHVVKLNECTHYWPPPGPPPPGAPPGPPPISPPSITSCISPARVVVL